MQLVLPFVVLGVMAIAMVVAAELARTAVARIAKLPLRRTRWKLADLPGVTGSGRVGARLAAILIGPLAGYLLIVVVAFNVYRCTGITSSEPPVTIGEVMPGYPAASDLAEGDRILEIQGESFPGGADVLSRAVNAGGGSPLTLTIERAGKRQVVRVEPLRHGEAEPWLLGVRMRSERVYDSVVSAKAAVAYPIRQLRAILRGLADYFTGREEVDPGGPMRIVAEYKQPLGFELGLMAILLGVYLWIVLWFYDLVRAIILLVRR